VRTKIETELHLNTQSVPRSKHTPSRLYQPTSQLMLYREIIAVCSEIHTKHINTLCGRNVEQLGSKDSQVKTQLVLWIFILLKVTTCFGLYHQAIIRSQINSRTWES